MPRAVAIVFDADFSSRLEALSFRMPVWLVDSESNRIAAEEAWLRAREWPQVSVTMFRGSTRNSRAEWTTLLEQIEMHHGGTRPRPFDLLEVIGASPTPAARVAFETAGFQPIEVTPDGFRAARVR